MDESSRLNDTAGPLPAWGSVLAVVAHPDDESFGLGAILDAFVRAGTTASVLCLTQGEASTLGSSVDLVDLKATRAAELRDAANHLGVSTATLLGYPDGALSTVDPEALTAEVLGVLKDHPTQGIVTFDPSGVSGHPDHVAATRAALAAAEAADLPVLGWTIPRAVTEVLNQEFAATFVGHEPDDVDLVTAVDRGPQRRASLAHASQAIPTSVLWRRLDLLGDREYLRWLRR